MSRPSRYGGRRDVSCSRRGPLSTQHHPAGERPSSSRTPAGIDAALSTGRSARFREELGRTATGGDFERLLGLWMCRARLDQRPDRAEKVSAARAGELPTTTWDEVQRQRCATSARKA